MTQSIHNAQRPAYRRIRSFVRRNGRVTSAQQLALDKLWPKYGIEYCKQLINLDRYFSRMAPISIDIGFGNGLSTLHIAQLHSDWNHLGIEVHRSGVGQLCHQLELKQVSNVKIISADAVDVLEHMIANETIDRFLIFFPDPWHKKRHHKRRLIQPGFVRSMAQKLKYGGIVHLATDWQPYAEWIRDVFEKQAEFSNIAGNSNYCQKPDYRPTTKFETRGKNLGHGVFDLIYMRI